LLAQTPLLRQRSIAGRCLCWSDYSAQQRSCDSAGYRLPLYYGSSGSITALPYWR